MVQVDPMRTLKNVKYIEGTNGHYLIPLALFDETLRGDLQVFRGQSFQSKSFFAHEQ